VATVRGRGGELLVAQEEVERVRREGFGTQLSASAGSLAARRRVDMTGRGPGAPASEPAGTSPDVAEGAQWAAAFARRATANWSFAARTTSGPWRTVLVASATT
jgi:hypothetical protein